MKKLTDKKIAELDAKDVLRVYTFQHPIVLENLQKTGILAGNFNYIVGQMDCYEDCRYFRKAYEWMQEQMSNRLPDYSGDLPIWAWPTRPNTRETKQRSKQPVVRIIADIPKERVLISDFYLWHDVLNDQHISLTEKEFDSFEQPTDIQKKKSWNRVFDITSPKTKEQEEWQGHNRIIQYCIDRIYQHEVVSIKYLG